MTMHHFTTKHNQLHSPFTYWW